MTLLTLCRSVSLSLSPLFVWSRRETQQRPSVAWLFVCLSGWLSLCLCLSVSVSVCLYLCLTHESPRDPPDRPRADCLCMSLSDSVCITVSRAARRSLRAANTSLSLFVSVCLCLHLTQEPPRDPPERPKAICLCLSLSVSVCVSITRPTEKSTRPTNTCPRTTKNYLRVCQETPRDPSMQPLQPPT